MVQPETLVLNLPPGKAPQRSKHVNAEKGISGRGNGRHQGPEVGVGRGAMSKGS